MRQQIKRVSQKPITYRRGRTVSSDRFIFSRHCPRNMKIRSIALFGISEPLLEIDYVSQIKSDTIINESFRTQNRYMNILFFKLPWRIIMRHIFSTSFFCVCVSHLYCLKKISFSESILQQRCRTSPLPACKEGRGETLFKFSSTLVIFFFNLFFLCYLKNK